MTPTPEAMDNMKAQFLSSFKPSRVLKRERETPYRDWYYMNSRMVHIVIGVIGSIAILCVGILIGMVLR